MKKIVIILGAIIVCGLLAVSVFSSRTILCSGVEMLKNNKAGSIMEYHGYYVKDQLLADVITKHKEEIDSICSKEYEKSFTWDNCTYVIFKDSTGFVIDTANNQLIVAKDFKCWLTYTKGTKGDAAFVDYDKDSALVISHYEITEEDREAFNEIISKGSLMGLMYNPDFIEFDVTGDGYPDLCASITQGSGIVSSNVMVYDVYNKKAYDLNGRPDLDYWIDSVEDNVMYIKRVENGVDRVKAELGVLRFEQDQLVFEEIVE